MSTSMQAAARRWSARLPTDRDVLVLAVLAAVVLLAGLGLRDPWPSDEPRFAAIARDMLASGDWLLPRIGGDLYADKPPLFFWLMAACIWLTGSVRYGFLLPSVVAGFVTLGAVYDIARRLYSRHVAFWAGIVLLATFQFPLEFKSAQIDPVVTMFTTLGLYGLLRHLALGPNWRWYAAGGFACGLGVITKGVGFLPLLVLLPYAIFAKRGWTVPVGGWSWRWLWAPGAALIGIAVWLVPLLTRFALAPSPEVESYLREILLGQTVGRYVDAAGHLNPWWYFLVVVIPWAWLPVSLALPWLLGHWRAAWHRRDLAMGLLLSWIGLVVLFFSLSSGKRGVYILPAVPALAVATAPYVETLREARLLKWLAWMLLGVVTIALAGMLVYLARVDRAEIADLVYGFEGWPGWLFVPLAAWGAICLLWSRPRRGLVGLGAFFLGLWTLYGLYVWPLADVFRSGKIIMDQAYERLPDGAELGVTVPKETLILHAHGALTNFGHRRPDRAQEQYDAARWLAASPERWLILPAYLDAGCFDRSQTVALGNAHDTDWLLAPSTAARASCARRGRAENVIAYRAPEASRD